MWKRVATSHECRTLGNATFRSLRPGPTVVLGGLIMRRRRRRTEAREPVGTDPAAERAWALFNLVNDWIKVADAKAAAVLAFIGAAAAALVVVIPPRDTLSPAEITVGSLCAISIAATGISALSVLWPRTKSDGEELPNPLFYGHIGGRFDGHTSYADVLRATLQDQEVFLGHLSQQIHANASVAKRKFSLVNWSIRALVVSVGLLASFITVNWFEL